MKSYVTWKAKKINDYCYQHPNTNGRANDESNGDIVFTETPYQAIDGRYMSFVEHSGALPQARLDALIAIDEAYEFTSVTEEQVNVDLLEAYGYTPGEGTQPQMVSVSDFIFTDLSPSVI